MNEPIPNRAGVPVLVPTGMLGAIRAVKISFPRPNSQGGVRDRDMHSGQQHVPVMHLPISAEA